MYQKTLGKKLFVIITFFTIISSFVLFPIQIEASSENTFTNNLVSDSTTEKNNEIIGYLGETKTTRASIGNIANHIKNHTFYIKNAFSGQYLDVYDGIASDGTNVIQYTYNGGKNQQWYISENGDDTFTLHSGINSNYVLDVNGGSSSDLANIQLWSYNGSDAQKFRIGYTERSIYGFMSKASNYEKCVVTHGYGCAMGDNVNQYTYSGHWNELWILEPVTKDVDLGARYATDNYNSYIYSYPNLTNMGGDCTNFVSQCMLASGIHYRNNWLIYRRNGNNTDLSNVSQLNDSWALTDPSPWISAPQFRNYWVNNVTNAYSVKASDVLTDPSIVWNVPITQGCAVQLAHSSFGNLGNSYHSMYISGYLDDGTNNTYLLTAHTSNVVHKSLLDVCRNNRDKYVLFYVF